MVTGAAGFLGFHVARRLLTSGVDVVGVDCFSPYYDPQLKAARFSRLKREGRLFLAEPIDIADTSAVDALFKRYRPPMVVHLAAQPGVRRALTEPHPYARSNIVAFLNILEGCRQVSVDHFVYASSSSVYGANTKVPFEEHDSVDHPVSLYAATKRSNELMAYSYSHLFSLPSTGLRFFTVYGPWGRPDMAVYSFTNAIVNGRAIEIANGGQVWRDFTYVDDVVEGTIRLLVNPPPILDQSTPPHRVYNIGKGKPESLDRLVNLIEARLGRRARRIEVSAPPGDVIRTHADISQLQRAINYVPSVSLEAGVAHFVDWYLGYHRITGPRGINEESVTCC